MTWSPRRRRAALISSRLGARREDNKSLSVIGSSAGCCDPGILQRTNRNPDRPIERPVVVGFQPPNPYPYTDGSPLRRENCMPDKLPILLFDVMGTLVYDPFYREVPAFFGMTLKQLIECKHPTAGCSLNSVAFPNLNSEHVFSGRSDLRPASLKECMVQAYEFLPGTEELLRTLRGMGYELHLFSNYSKWYQLIEDRLNLSRFADWSFVSCDLGLRKPSGEAFASVLNRLKLAQTIACSWMIKKRTVSGHGPPVSLPFNGLTPIRSRPNSVDEESYEPPHQPRLECLSHSP